MPSESPKTISVKRSSERSPGGNSSFGELASIKLNGQLFYGPEVVQLQDQRSDTQRPEVGTKDGKEAAVPDHTIADEANSTASSNKQKGHK
ncbi:hypothetical protein FPHYL_2623 [Fusarium phyllophilum]|uniref:Uncharacterized protein n=1 Tax=Fusarium phyllophilum TaxID=47803 RepID=A0A8H5KBR6_9HYPO|nr:hypothetical protein FPHYL_2623 [Fusarium phyllophilum]